jgi:hypothetical protein
MRSLPSFMQACRKPIADFSRCAGHPDDLTPQSKERTAMIRIALFLRRALITDCVFSGVSALALVHCAAALAELTALPEALLRETGLFLILYAALVGWLASRAAAAQTWIMLVIGSNAAWAVASIALLLSGSVHPNLFGQIVVVAQAIATAVLAELQYVGFRRSGSAIAV